MADRVELAFRKAAKALELPGASLLVAVSGGSDSIALLHLLSRTLRRPAPQLTVAHLDHGLRSDSTVDRAFVEKTARDLDLPFVAERRSVSALRRRDESPEEAARRVRRSFLTEAARRNGCSRIAIGHTMDDQAETVLLRLLRGAGPTALTGMRSTGAGPFVRPLLGLERKALRAWLTRRGLAWREDSTNEDRQFDRNRVRHEILPFLQEQTGLPVARRLVRAADRLREDAVWLDRLALGRLQEGSRPGRGNSLRVEAGLLQDRSSPLTGRIARLALAAAGCDPRRISARHVEALIGVASGPGGGETHLPQRKVARKRGNDVFLRQDDR